jgi:RNA polymerase sigma factor (sigma-70 family)
MGHNAVYAPVGAATLTTSAEFESCIIANQSRWIAWCRRFVPRHEAEDFVQHAALKAWCHLDQFKRDSTLSTWIFTIVRRLVIDSKRFGAGQFEHIPLWSEDGIALRYTQETVTRGVLFIEIAKLVQSKHITDWERHAIIKGQELYAAGEPMTANIKTARFRGIAKLRKVMGIAA